MHTRFLSESESKIDYEKMKNDLDRILSLIPPEAEVNETLSISAKIIDLLLGKWGAGREQKIIENDLDSKMISVTDEIESFVEKYPRNLRRIP